MKGKFEITISAIVVILANCFLSLPSLAASPAAADSLVIGGYTQTNEVRVNTYEYEYSYKAVITNTGPSVNAVVAVLSSLDPNIQVIVGTLTFGDISGNDSRISQNTFTIRRDVRYPLDSSQLSWRIYFQPGTKTADPVSASFTQGAGTTMFAETTVNGFQDTVVFGGLVEPAVVQFSSDGRVFVGEKSGIIKVYSSLSATTPTVFADLRTQVHNFGNRGLLGMVLHPSFPTQPYIYVLYAYDAPIGGTAPTWGTPGGTLDPCPDLTGNGCVASARLSRLQANGNVMTGAEQVLVNDWFQQYPGQSIGSVAFGPDGNIYASAGDGASSTVVDTGQLGNPNNDPPNEGGALRSQRLRDPAAPVTLDGSIVRVDPASGAPVRGVPSMTIGSPTTDSNGVKSYSVTSVFQGPTPTIVRVLEPTSPAPGWPRRFLYVLPVEAGLGTTYGDGLDELRMLNVHNRYNLTLIAPSFNITPWYGDHATDPTIRLESFMIQDLIPFGDSFAPAGTIPQRWVIGFSKSGWGAVSLTLRNPNVFSQVAGWDFPAQMNGFQYPGVLENFGTLGNLSQYVIPTLVSNNAAPFRTQNRIWISGDTADYTADMAQLDTQMTQAGIVHTFVSGTVRAHTWSSGWLDGAVSSLAANATATAPIDTNYQRIIAYGLRSPRRFTFRPGTSELWIGDIGWTTYEEINRVVNGTDGVTENFGWPCLEGTGSTSYSSVHLCDPLVTPPATISQPFFSYRHDQAVVNGDTCGATGGSISGLAFYTGGNYPSYYQGALFFADSSRNCIWTILQGANGLPDPATLAIFAAGASSPYDLKIGPNGDLFYVDSAGGNIRRMQYNVNTLAVAITAPVPNSTVANTVNVTTWTSSNVTSVQFQLDGANLGAAVTAPPYNLSWNSKTTTNGTHTLTAVASDGLGHTFTSTPVSVYVANVAVPQYVQGAATTNNSAGTSIARAFTTANVAGNLIVAAVSWNNGSVTCSDSQGNSYSVATTQYDNVNDQSLAICYAANVKAGANTVTATFSGSATYRRLLIHEYSGIVSVNPLDVVAKNSANGTTAANAITSTAAVTTASGDLIFGAVMDDSGLLIGITAGTGFTQRQSVNNKDMATEDLVQAAAGSIAATQTFSSADRYLAQMVAFKASIPGPSNAPPTVATPASASPNPVIASTTNLSVLGADDGGEANLTYTWATTGTPPAPVTFSANGTNAAKNVVATFTKAGSYSFQVTIKDQGNLSVTSSVSVTVNQTLTTISVAPSSATVAVSATQQFTATGLDQFGVALTTQPTFSWTVSGGGTINSSGLFTGTTTGGPFTVTASSGAINKTASVTVVNAAPTVATPASASPNPATGTTTNLSVLGADDGGEANLTYTWATTGTPPATVTFSANGTNAAKNVVATFTKSGSYSFQVTIKDQGNLTVTSSVSVTVNQTLTSISVTPASATTSLNASQQFTATGLDQFGVAKTTQPTFSWTVSGGGTINTAGLFTAGSTAGGPFTVTASSGSVNGTASVTVVNAAPTVATPASASPNPVTGTTTNLSVLGADDGGEANLTYTWATTGTPPAAVTFSANGTNAAKNAVATFTKAGSYSFQVTIKDQGNLTVTSSVSVTVNQTLTSISVAPSSASVTVSATQQFTATALDQFGVALPTQPTFSWTVSGGGTISTSGLFTAGSTAGGPFTVTASSGSVNGTASVTVVNAAPTVATPASASPNPVTASTTNLSVLGADDGGEANLTYTWATTGTPPAAVTFSANGTNAAKNAVATFTKAGSYTFQVTIKDQGNLTVTSSVSVTVNQTLTSISVAPSSATVAVSATQQFTATGLDQFGVALTTQPTFSWTVSGGGTINTAGLFTGTTTGGPFTVTASSGSVNGTASVTVVNAAPTVATPASASPNPATGTTTNLSALGADDGGEANLTYTWATTGTPPAAVTFSANGTNAAKNVVATFTKSGSYSFQVTIKDQGNLTVTSSVSVTVNQTLTSISVAPSSATTSLNASQQFTATGLDQFAVALTTQPTFSWTVSGGGTINTAGLFTAGSTAGGPFTVTASSGGVNGTASVTVVNAAPSVATPASASPNPVTASTTNLSVLGADDGGEANLTYTWATTGTPPAPVTFTANGTNAAKNVVATFTKSGSYSFQVTIKDQGNLTVTSSVSVTVNQTLTSISVAPSSATVTVSATQQFTATGLDQFGVALTTQPTFSWTVSGGGTINTSGLFTAGNTAGGPFTVTASSGSVNGTASVTVGNAPPTVATPASASPNPVIASTTNLSVLGADDGGEGNLTYTWATTGTPPAAVTFSANGTNAAKNVVATFTKSGSYSFQVTIKDQGNLTVTSSVSVTVNQTLTSISVAPSSATVAVSATQQFTATGLDQFGVALTTQPTFSWTVGGGGTINTSGLFTGTTTGGPFTVTASSGSVNGTASVTVVNAAPTVATPASASPNPATGTATNLSVLGADDGGEANLTYTWATTGTPPAPVTFSANGTNAAKNVVATFTKSGSYSFQVTIKDQGNLTVTSSVSVTVNQTLTSISVAPSSATTSLGASQQFTATGLDQFGVALTTQPTFSWTVSGGGTINTAGLFTAGSTAGGPFTVTASSGSVNGTASVTVVNAAPTVATPASASPNPVTASTTNLSVLGADDSGEANLTYTWATTGTPPAAVTFSANGTNAAKNAMATFTKAGSYSFQVTIKDQGNLTVTSSVNVTVNQTLTSISVTPSSATTSLGASQQFTVTGLDQFGVALTTQPTFSWTVGGGGTISTSGLFTAGSTAGGPFTVTASSGSVNGTASVTVVNAAPTVATPASASPNPVTASTTNLSVLGTDDGGEANLIYTWATTGTPPAAVTFSANGTNAAKNVVATFTKSGSYSFQVTIKDQGNLTVTSSVSVTVNQTLTSISVAPSSATVAVSATQQFTATGLDQFGVALTTQPTFSWTVSGGGTINTSGLFTGTTTGGPFTVTASSGSVNGTASVTVVNAAPTVATPASASPNPATGTTTNLSALGADDGGEANLTYTWATTGTPPAAVTFSANGTNAAKNVVATFTKAGSYSFQVTIKDQGNLTVTSSVSVTVNQTLTSISVAPSSATTSLNASQQFTATGLDQFAVALTTQPTFSWTVSGGGTINTAGLFTAGSTAGGPFTVTASSGGVNGTASVTVVNAAPSVATPASASPNPVTAATTNLSVLGADDGGEANLTYTWATTGTPPAPVTFGANGTNAAKNVVATFTKSGSYSFQVTIKDQGNLTVTSSVNVTVNQTLTSISVAPSSASVTVSATQQFTATARDQFGIALTTQPAFSWTVSGGGTISATGLFTGTTAGGPFTVTASSGGINGTASVTVTAAALVAYVQGAATTNNATGTSMSQAFTTANVAGNLIVAAVSWSNGSVTCSDSQGNSYSVATTQYDNVNDQSLAICYAANVKAGANTVTATFSGSATYRRLLIHEYQGVALVNPVDVVAKNNAAGSTAANAITSTAAVTTASGDLIFGAVMDDSGIISSITAGTSFTQRLSVNNKDMATEDLVQAAAGSIAATQTFGSADRYLAQMVAFKAGSGSSNAPPTVATPASASPNPVTASTTNLSVLGADDGGEANLTYTWATTGTPPAAVTFSANGTNAAKNAVATFTKAGSYSLQVTIRDQGNLAVTSSVSVTVNQTFTSISVAPSSAIVAVSGTQQFTATALDQFGGALTAQPAFSWTVSGGGTISTAGLFTAGSTAGGPFTVTASSGGINGTASVTVAVTAVPQFVQGAATTNDASSTSVTQAFTTANVAGNLIVAAVSWGSNATVTCSDSQGNSYSVATTQFDNTNAQSLAICYAANVKAGANTVTATFSGSTTYRRLLIHEYSGVALVNPLDVVAKNNANGTTAANAITSGAAVTTASGDLIFGAVMDDSGIISSITAGSGFTQRLSVNNKDMATEDLVQAAAGSIAATHTFGSADRYLAQMVAFKHQ